MNRNWFAISTLAASLALPAGMAARANAAPAPLAPGLHQNQDRDGDWDRAPDDYRDAQREGFHDGIEAARRDWDRHRHRDADDHERYKHPPVDRDMVHDYRDGFKHGYRMAMDHMRSYDRNRGHDDDRPDLR